MQVLQQQGGDDIQTSIAAANHEVTITTIADGDDDDNDMGMMGAPQEIQIEVAQDDLTQTLTGTLLYDYFI